MFDLSWIADLSADAACEVIEATQVELRERELHELALAGQWAVLHGPETLAARRFVGPGSGPSAVPLPGAERSWLLGGDGTPEVTEFACAELAVVMGIGPVTASNLMCDALDLQHRHPAMWAALVAGQGRVWKARKVARRVHAVGLSCADARTVDTHVTPYLDSLPWGSFQRLVEAEIIAVDPAAADERRRARELEQFVSAGQSDEHGLKTLIARAEAGEVIVFLAMVSRIADILVREGDTSPAGSRRARAIGVLAQPAWALQLLQRWAATTRPADPDPESGPDPETDPGPEPELEPGQEPASGCCPTCGDQTPGWTRSWAPFPVDPDKLRPKAVLHLRTTLEALRAGTGVAVLDNDNDNVAPLTIAEATQLLGHCQVSIRPLLDLRDQLPVDAYEVPAAMRETLRLSRPRSVFPWTVGGRRTDLDHTRPYLSPDQGGPPGQTATDNLGPLDRFGHRVKTHARGWRHHQPTPGTYLWRTPHGYWVHVDQHGTHPLGRHPDTAGTDDAGNAQDRHLQLVEPPTDTPA